MENGFFTELTEESVSNESDEFRIVVIKMIDTGWSVTARVTQYNIKQQSQDTNEYEIKSSTHCIDAILTL